MGTLNEILSLMSRMDKGYSQAVCLNENTIAYNILIEDKRINQARQRSRYIIQNIFSKQDIDEPTVEMLLNKFENEFYHDPRMRSGQTMRLEPLFCRLAFENGFQQGNENQDILQRLKKFLNMLFVNQGEIDLKSIDINNTTYDNLEEMFGEAIDDEFELETKEIAKTEYSKNDYEIVGPLDFQTANKYGNQSCPSSKLCYTQSENTWNGYTKEGKNKAYVALKNGWLNIKPVHDTNFVSPYDPTHTQTDESPYDTYGLSMIFVFVNQNGELTTCNTRWNHRADYPNNIQVDHALNRKQVSEIIGQRFFDVFLPDMTNQKAIIDAVEKFNNGDTSGFNYYTKINDNVVVVVVGDKWNVIVDGTFLFNKWIDGVAIMRNGLYRLDKGDKHNFMNKNGKVLSKFWYDDYFTLDNGFIVIEVNNYRNVINNEGNVIWKKPLTQWLESIGNFHSSWSRIKYNGQWNFMNENGDLLWNHPFEEWFDKAEDFYNGLAVIMKNNRYNIINAKGELLSNDWNFSFVDASDNDVIFVRIGDKYNFIGKDGEYIWKHPLEEWFDFAYIGDYSFNADGKTYVSINGYHNYIDKNGNLVWDKPINEWFNNMYEYFDGLSNKIYYVVDLKDKYNQIDANGNLIWDKPVEEWFDWFDYIYGNYAEVQINKRWNIIHKDGYLVWKHPIEEWFDSVSLMEGDTAKVKLNRKFSLLNLLNGQLIWDKPSDEWFYWIGEWILPMNVAKVTLDARKWNFIRKDGTLVLDEWADDISNVFSGQANVRYGDKGYLLDINSGKMIPTKYVN